MYYMASAIPQLLFEIGSCWVSQSPSLKPKLNFNINMIQTIHISFLQFRLSCPDWASVKFVCDFLFFHCCRWLLRRRLKLRRSSTFVTTGVFSLWLSICSAAHRRNRVLIKQIKLPLLISFFFCDSELSLYVLQQKREDSRTYVKRENR